MTDATQDRATHGALRLSVIAGACSAVLAVVWGLAAGSRVILFDGVSAAIGLVMSLLSLAASRAAAAGDSPAFPYGRQALQPMAIGAQGVARLGFTAYAVTDALLVIRAGGDDVETRSALLYAAVAASLCIGVTLRLRAPARRDELVAAEELGWRIASLLSLAILIGFSVVALLPDGEAKTTAARYVDPVLVLVVSLIVLPAPVRLVRTMFRELLEMRPPTDIEEPARAAVTEVCASMGLHAPVIRMTKTGGRLYLEVDHVVEAGEWDVSRIDLLRAALLDRLTSPAYAVWLNVELSCDPTWQLA